MLLFFVWMNNFDVCELCHVYMRLWILPRKLALDLELTLAMIIISWIRVYAEGVRFLVVLEESNVIFSYI